MDARLGDAVEHDLGRAKLSGFEAHADDAVVVDGGEVGVDPGLLSERRRHGQTQQAALAAVCHAIDLADFADAAVRCDQLDQGGVTFGDECRPVR